MRCATFPLAIVLLCFAVSIALCHETAVSLASVSVPVTDLRDEPQSAAVSYAYDSLQLTQLIYNEVVEVYHTGVIDSNGQEWYFVGAREQLTYDENNQLIPYPGFLLASHLVPYVAPGADAGEQVVVKANYLPLYGRDCHMEGCLPEDQVAVVPMGTTFQGVVSDDGWVQTTQPGGSESAWGLASGVASVTEMLADTESAMRQAILTTAKNLLGVYYFWGGRSPLNGQLYTSGTQLTGMDCSGFVSLAYRANSLVLPRNANDVFHWSKNVTGGAGQLEVADFLFNAHPDNPDHATHIMMVYRKASASGGDLIMESATNSTRIISSEAKFGMSLAELTWGGMDHYGNLVYWGTGFPFSSDNELPIE